MFGVGGIFRDVVADLKPKHLVVGAAVLFVTAWAFSRLLPGAAARMGLRPRPLFPDYQNTWPEPFGLSPLIGAGPMATPAASRTTGPTQAQLGQAIVTAAQGGASSSDILQSITSGNA